MAARLPIERRHHGDVVVDDYEWLRAKDDPRVREYLQAENAYAATRTAHLQPLREELFTEISDRTQQTDLTVPVRRRGWWYYARTHEGAEYPVYCRSPIADATQWTPPALDPGQSLPHEQVLLDVNEAAEGHPFFSLGAFSVSQGGDRLLYSVDTTGDERFTLRVVQLGDRATLAEIPEVFYGGAFSQDGNHVFYALADHAWRPYEIRRHEIGTAADRDAVLVHEADERFWLSFSLTTSRQYLLAQATSKTTSEAWVLDLADPNADPVLFAPRRSHVEYDVEHVAPGDWWVVVHNDGAPNFTIALSRPGEPWHHIGIVDADTRVSGCVALARAVAFETRRQGLPQVLVVPVNDALASQPADVLGLPWTVDFDEALSNAGIGRVGDADAPVLRVNHTSFITPAAIYDVDLVTTERLLRKQTQVLGGVDLNDYAQHREWAVAADATLVPISVVCRRGFTPDGSHPVLLYGYGSYEHSIDPSFSVPRLSLLDRGVVFAFAHVRGGGEMGRHWYEQGRLMHKQNTFTDFVDSRDHLVRAGWADPDRVVAMGGSAGGLLVGAAANLAPEKFAGVLAQVPFVDALTTVLDPTLPLTVLEWEEWGDPLHDAAAYAYIKSYAPYENVSAAKYPAILATTSLNDTRVLYVEPAKWVAKLRHRAAEQGLDSGRNILLKTEMDAGHGGASGRYESWKEQAYEMAWTLNVLGVA